MMTPAEAKARATATYNAAADSYDDTANSFWERFGRRTIERLHLQPGARVLDVCCGSGASAIPAAEKVGPKGFVLGIDLAERLLERARSKATKRGLYNLEFRVGDMLDMRVERAEFDVVVCVFGIFFVPDMRAGVQALSKVVRPGGRLAITTWGPRWFEPATTAFWNAVREIRPDLYKGFNPWDRICDPESVRALLAEAGIQHAEVIAEAFSRRIRFSPQLAVARQGQDSGLRGSGDSTALHVTFDRFRFLNADQVGTILVRPHSHAS
jgi:ubiquinone/menaquinone biosynthesis C-methylase UbiE